MFVFGDFNRRDDLPVNKSPLGIHQVELVVKSGPSLGDSGRVAQHADGALNFGEIATRDNRWWLVVDSDLDGGLRRLMIVPAC